jgi:hypothetical protein
MARHSVYNGLYLVYLGLSEVARTFSVMGQAHRTFFNTGVLERIMVSFEIRLAYGRVIKFPGVYSVHVYADLVTDRVSIMRAVCVLMSFLLCIYIGGTGSPKSGTLYADTARYSYRLA